MWRTRARVVNGRVVINWCDVYAPFIATFSLFLYTHRLRRWPHRISNELNTDADQFQLQNFKCGNIKSITANQLSPLSGIEQIEPMATGPN